MPRINSQINPSSQAYKKNRAAMLSQIGNLRDLERMIRARSEQSRDRFQSRNQLC